MTNHVNDVDRAVAADAAPSGTNLEQALAYVARGLRVVFLHEVMPDGTCSCGNRNNTCPSPKGKDSTAKHPREKAWLENLIVDEAGATAAWGRCPTANIGICPNERDVVLDIDPRNGGDETFAKLVYELGELAGPRALTGGGGEHCWIGLPDGVDVATATRLINRSLAGLGPGIDLRTCRNQVVVAPSLHMSGKRYEWAKDRSILECSPVVPSSGWLAALGLAAAAADGSTPGSPSGGQPYDDDLPRAEWGLLHARLLSPDKGYNDWFRIGAALKAFGDAGLRLWIEASRPSQDFDEQEIRSKWPGIGGSSVNALFGMFDDADPKWRERYREHQSSSAGQATTVSTGASCSAPSAQREWPKPMTEKALHGLAGDFIRLVRDETEADQHALLVQFLAFFGNCIGRSPFLMVGPTRHGTNLFAIIAGATARGRKGTSEGEVRRLMHLVDGDWTTNNICSGLSSGEGLIDVIRDPREGPPDKQGKPTLIPGVVDKRCMVSEGEFARVLAQVARDGNVLSSILRQAWDGETLGTMVRNNPARATDPHISVVAHVTKFELLARMSETDLFNGLGNRFLWCCSRRTKKLPFGGNVDQQQLGQLAAELRSALSHSRRMSRIGFTVAGTEYWGHAYGEISIDRPGLWGALTARAEAQVLRLAMLYALLDSESDIDVPHLEAGRAVWDYCDASVAHLFGDKLGNPTADKVLAAIRAAGPTGLARTKISAALGRNTPAAEIDAALMLLVDAGLAWKAVIGSGRQAAETWWAK